MTKDDGTEEAKGGLLDETVKYHVQLKKGDISDFVHPVVHQNLSEAYKK